MIIPSFGFATANDIKEIVDLRLEYFKEIYNLSKEEFSYLYNANIEYLENHLNKDCFVTFVRTEKIVTTIFLNIYTKSPNLFCPNSKYGELYGVFTRREDRYKGYATKALELLLERAKELDISAITLGASNDGIKLYKKLGFREETFGFTEMEYNIKTIKNYIKNTEEH